MPLNTAVMFGKATDEWETPQATFNALDAEFNFGLDAAATYENAKCTRFLSDALEVDWNHASEGQAIWLNPPYSRVREFMAKANRECVERGCTIVCLVPARTDTRWWHDYVYYGDGMWWPAVTVRFIKGRLKFGNSTNSAPFPSVVIVFRPVSA